MQPNKPFNNMVELWDDTTNTYYNYITGESVSRPFTQEEIDFFTMQAQKDTISRNMESVLTKITAALGSNSTFLALATPTNAQTLAQVKALTRQMNALMRFVGNKLDTLSDT